MNWQREFHGPNAGYLLEAHERFLADRNSVEPELRALFDSWAPTPLATSEAANGASAVASVMASAETNSLAADVARFATRIRNFGHLWANIDPLGLSERAADAPALSRFDSGTLRQLPGTIVNGTIGQTTADAATALQQLQQIYMGSIGYDWYHITDPTERDWLREAAETRRFHPSQTPIDDVAMLQRLTEVEGFEQFLHRTFVGKKRFSIEGLDMMVPILDILVDEAAATTTTHFLIGMAHRGRLNVLTHVLRKPYAQMLAEFKDFMADHADVNWTGDVKYHSGAIRHIEGEVDLTVQIAANPSHLELVTPVIEGMARAAGSTANERGEVRFVRSNVMPILIHGDAAFAGQGIVPETFQMHQLPGWRTGGTVHIIANNQVGFTTDDEEARSTRYASDIVKGFGVPIVHVNANDVEACVEVARMAFAFTNEFEKDFLIDLVGYRRYGHNEGDEPRFTQVEMYKAVDNLPTVRQLWATTLEQRGVIDGNKADEMAQAHFDGMQTVYDALEIEPVVPVPFQPDPEDQIDVDTTISAETLQAYNQELLTLPAGFTLHKGLRRVHQRRLKALDDLDKPAIDWGQAESLAFASILSSGTPIRITGEDVERGTFSHRHAVLRNQADGKRHIPLQALASAHAGFECRNSPLSEEAALAFEYGYSMQAGNRLVMWEAQFGDFINGAQAVIDEYISSGHAKWGQHAPLVMLLPHGYEGQGPDHSSARLERFLMLAADRNMRIVYPTTAAQYFHLLRRHVGLLGDRPKPLVVMSPKSLLRHEMARSSLRELAEGHWQRVIDDPTVTPQRRRFIKRIVFCTGKVFVDTFTSEQRPEKPDVALVRVEQLYRFPLRQVREIVASYKGAQEIVWLQEEPKNGGAWNYVRPLLEMASADRLPIRYIGRPHRASPAEGSLTWHKIHQNEIIHDVYNI